MSRLVIFSEAPIASDSTFTKLLTEAKIAPERQTFASAESVEEVTEIMLAEGGEFSLLCGEQPFKLIRPDLTTRTACGRPFYWGEKEFGGLATVNPSALERNDIWVDSIRMHLDTLVRWAKRPEEMLEIAPKSCTQCAETPADHLDADLFPFCDRHKS